MFMLNDRPLPIDVPFTDASGTQYPANWLRLSTAEEKQGIGITEVADPVPFDDRFYWGVGNPKNVDDVKAVMITQIKQTSYNFLQSTDYKVTRAAEQLLKGETPDAIDSTILAYRDSVRAAYQTNKTAIDSATTVEDLAALQLAWPDSL